MNWLAHLLLAEPTPAFRVASLLPDLVPAAALSRLPAAYREGIERHHRVDAFTDSHPVVRRSVRRFDPPFRRYGGILTDVIYDHFLAREWDDFSAAPLAEFTRDVYASFEECRADIPPGAAARLDRMREEDWLGSYGGMRGITAALDRIGSRFRRRFDLASAVPILEARRGEFRADFRGFFPEWISQFATVRARGLPVRSEAGT